MTSAGRPEASREPPQAILRPRSAARASWLWALGWVLLLAGIAVLVLISWSRWDDGLRIVIRFQDGHGLKAGDALRHRGIDVGRVRGVRLNAELNGIDVECELLRHASGLARLGSRFWIEHPRVSLNGLSGLDTVMGSKYISVVPAPHSSSAATEFRGLEHPLSLGDGEDTIVTVRFLQGFGLSTGDQVKHRGITVGEVVDVSLDEPLKGVLVRVRLVGAARRLAKAGTQFWIVRPSVTFSEVRGLDTLVGGRYLAVMPGHPDATSLAEFQGLEDPPAASNNVDGGLEIVLEADVRRGWERGSPVQFRGMRVGEVLSVALASDGLTVEARAMIDPNYRTLIRDNTKFWDESGMDVHVGLSGFDVNMGTLESL
ncbi:MAG TPA: MlaD family protein, partial [Pirellulaceae bacterium]